MRDTHFFSIIATSPCVRGQVKVHDPLDSQDAMSLPWLSPPSVELPSSLAGIYSEDCYKFFGFNV